MRGPLCPRCGKPLSLLAAHVCPTKGIGGHQSAASATDEWLTPPDLLAQLGAFDLDPCAPVARLWDTARDHMTSHDDGTKRRWDGRVWFNPPYSEPWLSLFMARMAEHQQGVGLLFARTETEWFHRYVWRRAAGFIALEGRLHFHYGVDWFDKKTGELIGRRGERARSNAGGPHCLIAYGMDDLDRLAELTHLGQFVPLMVPRSVAALAIPETWRSLLAQIMRDRGPMRLDELYSAVARHAKANGLKHWRAKVRQTLQRGGFERTAPATWSLA